MELVRAWPAWGYDNRTQSTLVEDDMDDESYDIRCGQICSVVKFAQPAHAAIVYSSRRYRPVLNRYTVAPLSNEIVKSCNVRAILKRVGYTQHLTVYCYHGAEGVQSTMGVQLLLVRRR